MERIHADHRSNNTCIHTNFIREYQSQLWKDFSSLRTFQRSLIQTAKLCKHNPWRHRYDPNDSIPRFLQLFESQLLEILYQLKTIILVSQTQLVYLRSEVVSTDCRLVGVSKTLRTSKIPKLHLKLYYRHFVT